MSDNLPIQNPPASMVMTRIGGKNYPLVSKPNCKTCQSPHRMHIENLLIQGRTYKGIVRTLEGADGGILGHPSADGIAEHYKRGHMPLPQAAKRRLIERRAQEIGANMDSEIDTLVDKVTVANMIVHAGFERIAAGEVSPDVTQTLQAIKILHELEKDENGSVDQEVWASALMAVMETVREVVTEEQWMTIGRKFATNPVLQSLSKRAQQRPIEGEVVGE